MSKDVCACLTLGPGFEEELLKVFLWGFGETSDVVLSLGGTGPTTYNTSTNQKDREFSGDTSIHFQRVCVCMCEHVCLCV